MPSRLFAPTSARAGGRERRAAARGHARAGREAALVHSGSALETLTPEDQRARALFLLDSSKREQIRSEVLGITHARVNEHRAKRGEV